jgi:hypothetical protein
LPALFRLPLPPQQGKNSRAAFFVHRRRNTLMARAAREMNLGTPQMQTDIDGSVFAGFKRMLRTGALIFAFVITVMGMRRATR